VKAYCVILAGGTGSRMGADVPKQFIALSGVPIIIRTIRRVMECKRFEKIVVAIHPDWDVRFHEMLVQGGISPTDVLVAIGGEKRHDSIANALRAIHEYAYVSEEDVVVIHDAVRPFVGVSVLNESVNAAFKYGACVATLPAVDTMLEVEDGIVKQVPPRTRLFHGQAPDSARILLFEKALASLTAEERNTITGTAQILVVKGVPVKAIAGNPENVKITTPPDMEFAARYLESKEL